MINVEALLRNPKNMLAINRHKVAVSGLNFETDFNDEIDKVLIIPGPFSQRAYESSISVGMNPVILDSFYYPDRVVYKELADYYSKTFSRIEKPKSLENQDWPNHIKLYSSTLTYYDICRTLNHMIAWSYSVTNNEPVVILENDSILYEKHTHNQVRTNSITMLGDIKLYRHNTNWICGSGVYAYSIDTFAAKNLFNKVMTEGIINPLELMFRIDEFNVVIQKKACRFQALASKEEILLSS
jgi:hypothetical protein